jgi:hypothetical protein
MYGNSGLHVLSTVSTAKDSDVRVQYIIQQTTAVGFFLSMYLYVELSTEQQHKRPELEYYLNPVTAPTDASTTAMITINPRTMAQHIHFLVFLWDTLAACRCATPLLMCSALLAT